MLLENLPKHIRDRPRTAVAVGKEGKKSIHRIMQRQDISALLFWGSIVYFCRFLWQYDCVWWDSPVDGSVDWSIFFKSRRKRTTLAGLIMILALILPSIKEAIIMTVVPAVTQSPIWDRLLGGGADKATIDEARKMIRYGGE